MDCVKDDMRIKGVSMDDRRVIVENGRRIHMPTPFNGIRGR
jgi:hypothetical protein